MGVVPSYQSLLVAHVLPCMPMAPAHAVDGPAYAANCPCLECCRICERRLCETVDVETVATTLTLAEQNHADELKKVRGRWRGRGTGRQVG